VGLLHYYIGARLLGDLLWPNVVVWLVS